jgi:hypothetical protein
MLLVVVPCLEKASDRLPNDTLPADLVKRPGLHEQYGILSMMGLINMKRRQEGGCRLLAASFLFRI